MKIRVSLVSLLFSGEKNSFLSHVTSGARFGGAVSHRAEKGAGGEWQVAGMLLVRASRHGTSRAR